MKKNELIYIKNLNFFYSENEHVLKDISLKIFSGEKIALLGANGAGKSTFFLNLNGILSPSSGDLYYRGEKIGHSRKDFLKLRKNIGLVFQDPDSQIIGNSVLSEVSFGPFNLKLPEEEIKKRTEKSLNDMNITKYKNKPPHYLSGGEKKRVTIADITAMEPEVILFDEPTASLDPANTEGFLKVLKKLEKEQTTLIISTHDVNFAYEWAERILVFSDGYIIADDTPEKVFSKKEVLKKAGLNKPLLFEVWESLLDKGIVKDRKFPSDIKEFKKFL